MRKINLAIILPSSPRSINIVRHISWSVFFKLGSIIANFLMVPLAIKYLGADDYGIWLVLSSMLNWFMLFDIGLGNGLRNKFAEAKALGRHNEAQAFVSTAYYTIAVISTVIVLCMWIINIYVDWASVFNTSQEKSATLSLLLPVVFSFFGLQLVAKLIVSVYQADQYHSINDKVQFFVQLFSLGVIWLLYKVGESSLFLFGAVYSALPIIILVALNIIAFNGRYENYRPIISSCKKCYLKDITGLSFKFFIIQIASVVLFTTDNIILAQLFGPAEVVPYNIAYKYFSILTIGYSVLIVPFWSSFTDAYSKQDMAWIRKTVSIIQKIWIVIPVCTAFMVYLSDWFYRIWVGDTVKVPLSLTLSMALYVLLITFNMIYVNYINGVGKIRLQLVVSVVVMFANIPLSILLADNFGMGASGVILATSICLGIPSLLWWIQYNKLINGTAQGIWS